MKRSQLCPHLLHLCVEILILVLAHLFQEAESFIRSKGSEKIELLIQYAESLPNLPDWLEKNRDEMDQVHECMTPVFVHPEKTVNGLIFHFDVPAESPTVRGFASMMKQGLDHASPDEVLAVPGDFFTAMGLEKVLSR